MIALLILGIVAIVVVVATVIVVARDGYGPVRTDWTRLPDHRDTPAPAQVRETRVAASPVEKPQRGSLELTTAPAPARAA